MVQVMGVAVKSKRKKTHTDPYSRGERSGKKAKPDVLTTSVPPALVPSVSTPAFLPHHVASTPTSMRITANSHYFNEAAIDLRNMALLRSLLHAQLNRLCKYYGVKAKGTNEDIIHTLSAIVYPPPPSQTLCPTL
ncbi:hypothetical protein L208DRAFT_1463266 [Tricholoma matsutake]|nr:hypothetical protein L208DRAFT_1463266 [Tricholoma matsutake 945]